MEPTGATTTPEQISVALQSVQAHQATVAALLSQQQEGFETGRGYRLAVGDSDVQAFTKMTVLVQTALATGAIGPETPQQFADRDGQLHGLPAAQFISP